MDINLAKEEIKRLSELLEYHSKKYYEEDSPEISDNEYDLMFRQLQELEAEFPELVSPTSPTHRVGGAVATRFEKVKHEFPMGSISDVFSISELEAFDTRVKSVYPNAEYVVEYKIDGLSVSLEYINGIFTRGATRGDGDFGEDVTSNLRTISSLPLKINTDVERLVVRGEVYMSKENFALLNNSREENGEKIFANPRNAAAGSLRQLDPTICASRKLDLFVFNLQYSSESVATNHKNSLDYLQKCGFKVSPERCVFSNISDVSEKIMELGEKRKSFVSDIDGAVVKVNDFGMRENLGSTTSAPRWAVAFKYPPETAETVLDSISIKVGRTGVLTPNAEFNTVRLAGTKVSRATLHNIDYIKQKDIRIGDTIIVRKAGDIIPEVVGVNLSKRPDNTKEYEFPKVCPACGGDVLREDGEAAIRCINLECPAQLHRNICHYASRDAMNIETLGESVILSFLENGLIKNVSDLYSLRVEDIANLERMGEKSASNIIKAIEKSKEAGLGKLIFALGIRHIGEKAASALANHFGSMENIMNSTVEELCSVDDIGLISAESVIEFFSVPKNKMLIERLNEFGVVMESKTQITGDALAGMTVVITGTLPTLKRSEAEELVINNGGKCSSSVSKKTSFVLCGESAGSKLTKAESLGIPIIDEAEFFERLGL